MSVRLLNTGVSALNANATGLEVVGHNITNSLSTAFKSSEAKYATRFYDVMTSALPSTATASGRLPTSVGLGTSITATVMNFKQGSIVETGNPLDAAIDGGGMFKVRDVTNGSFFATRAGEFSLDNGYLATNDRKHIQGLTGSDFKFTVTKSSGQYEWSIAQSVPLSSAPGDIKVTPSSVTVANNHIDNQSGDSNADVEAAAPSFAGAEMDETGNIIVRFNNGAQYVAGQILLLNIDNPAALTPDKNGLYRYNDSDISTPFTAAGSTPGKNGLGKILSSKLESSNVDLTEEFANLIKTQRAFQASARIVDTASQLLSTVVNLGA